jgi:hypothetical protein
VYIQEFVNENINSKIHPGHGIKRTLVYNWHFEKETIAGWMSAQRKGRKLTSQVW